MSLEGLNLNHLVALQALLVEEGVAPAARRMGVTQSAMSHTLRQLRELLEDPLLARVGNEMTATPYAREILPRLTGALGELESIVSKRAAFDPESITDTFTVAIHDGVSGVLGGRLVSALRDRAPRAGFRIVPVVVETLARDMEVGSIDLSFLPPVLPLPGLRVKEVENTAVDFVVVCRRDHPTLAKRISLDAYCELGHVMGTITGEGTSFVDEILTGLGRKRRIVARVPYMFALGDIVSRSDLIATVPTIVAGLLGAHWRLKDLRPPFEIPTSDMALVWHPRFDGDPASTFFRELFAEVVREFMVERRAKRSKRR